MQQARQECTDYDAAWAEALTIVLQHMDTIEDIATELLDIGQLSHDQLLAHLETA